MEEITVSAELERAFGENPAASDGERYAASLTAEDDLDECASDNVKLRMCYFRSSTITVGKIKEMEQKGYFLEGVARIPGAETVPRLNGDEAVVYKDFFITGMCHRSVVKKNLGSRQLRCCAFSEFVCETL
jgi:hypothetical protein